MQRSKQFIPRLLSETIAPLLLFCLLGAAAFAVEADFCVAPNGNDQNPGTVAKPFATVVRAQAAVREKLAAGHDKPINVVVRGGAYYMDAPLVFTPEDSGRKTAPVTYQAWPGETPVISGGRPISGWKRNDAGHWETQIDAVKQGEWAFSQLFVNDTRRLRPRLPNKGSYFIERDATPRPGEKDPSHDRLHFRDNDIRDDWHNLQDTEIVVFHIWTASIMRPKTVDAEKRLCTLTAVAGNNDAAWSGLRRDHRYFIENVREALDEPGEWYLDRRSGLLTYIPMPGERPETATVIAPRLKHLVKIEANVDKGESVEYLRFEGLTFAHTNYVVPPEGYSCAQAEVTLDGAIRADGARDCVFSRCVVRQVAQYAIQLNTGCSRNRVDACDLYDLGAGGVQIGAKIGGYWFSKQPYGTLPKTTEVIGGHNEVVDTTIAHGGRMFPAAVGVWIGGSPYNRIAHNHIHDLFYTGISPGWVWGYNKSLAHHNTIEQNHIHNLGQRVLSDMGGIYTLGIAPGTVLRHNHIHDVYSYAYGGWGIYFDEGTTYMLAENNLAYRVKDGGFHQHYGRENWVRNNIFAFSDEAQVKRSREEEHLSFEFTNNIVYWKGSDLLGGNISKLDTVFFDYNLYWKADDKNFKFLNKTFKEWQSDGQDVHSLVADPGFADPERGDFTLADDTPAKKIGFVPFDLSRSGRLTPSRMPTDLPRPDTAFLHMLPYQKPPPRSIHEGFEDQAAGSKPMEFNLHEENKTAVVRVTNETAASGQQSLKFIDAPGQTYGFNPHITTDPNTPNGAQVIERFKVRVESGANFQHEWRTAGDPYKVGPSIEIRPSGDLASRGKILTSVPFGVWIGIELRCKIGSKEFDLTLTVPEKEPARFAGLPCDAGFDSVRWIGFVSQAEKESVFYLDDLDYSIQSLEK